MLLLLLTLGPIGCSDYGFGHPDDEFGSECFDRLFEGEAVETDPSCQE